MTWEAMEPVAVSSVWWVASVRDQTRLMPCHKRRVAGEWVEGMHLNAATALACAEAAAKALNAE